MSNPFAQPSVLLRRTARLLVVATLVVGAGCNTAALTRHLDPGSRARLATISGNRSVLISLTGSGPLSELPPLDGGRVLGRSGNTVLIEMPRGSLSRLAEVHPIERAMIWGPADVGERIEPALRRQLIEAIDGSSEPGPLSMLATFREGTKQIAERIRVTGAETGTVAGTVATIRATPGMVFDLIPLPELKLLSRPKEIRSSDG